MEPDMKDTGSKIYSMDLERKSGQMEANIMVTTFLVRNMVRELTHGLMDQLTMVIGMRIE